MVVVKYGQSLSSTNLRHGVIGGLSLVVCRPL